MVQRGGKGSGSGSLIKGLDQSNPLRFVPDLTKAIVQARNVQKQFNPGGPGFHTMLVQAHREMAEHVQVEMVKALRQAIESGPRAAEQRQTQWLEKALANPENIGFNIDGFVVNTSYLDKSPVRGYWRGLEEGTEVHVGRLITGFFADRTLSTRYAPAGGGDMYNARMIQLRPTPGVNYAVSRTRSGRTTNPSEHGIWRFHIRHPIEPRHYMRRGIETYQKSGFTEQRYKKLKADLEARAVK